MTEQTEKTAEATAIVTAAPDAAAPQSATSQTAETPAAEEDDGPPFNLRASLARIKRAIRNTFETATVPQCGIALGAVLMALGLTLLPPPVAIGHLLLGIGAVMMVLAVVWGAPAAQATVEQAPAMERVVGIVEGIERKIERLKDTQWELNESEFRYRDLLDAQDDVIVRRDAEGRLTFVNHAFTRVFGQASEAVLGKPFQPIVHEGESPAQTTFAPALRRTYTQRIDTAGGARWFAWEEQLIPAAEGQTHQYQCVGRDFTAERQAQTELAQARDAAQAASRAKSRFLAVMSHEIRTPMNGILGMTSLLEETELTAEQETYTRAVGQSAKTLLGIIDEILDFSKIEAGHLDLQRKPFALDEAVQGVVELLAPRAHEKGLEIAWTLAPSLPRMVVGDETRVRQVLMNLIGNAIKFTDRGGISVEVSEQTGKAMPADGIGLQIRVQDTGIGIEPAALATIFSEFEQVDPSRTRRHAGTGLGLAISRHLAQAMCGCITADSQLGAGSTFTLHANLERAQTGGTIAEALAPLRSAKRVLLAFDETIEANAMAATLRANGATAVIAAPGQVDAAMAAATEAQTPFDVLLVGASAQNGEAGEIGRLLAVLQQGCGPQVRGIVVMKASERSRLKMFREAGFAGYLVRPVRAASLLAQIGVGAITPAVPVRPASGAAPLASRPSTDGWRPRVLLAEDNDIGALLACAMLDKSGCDVVHARTGADAVAAFERSLQASNVRPFDLILMDVHMPVMDGLEATRRIREMQRMQDRTGMPFDNRLPSPPVVALTANAFSEDRAQCLEAGMVDYLAKPFVKAELMAVIGKWCRPQQIGRGHGTIDEAAA